MTSVTALNALLDFPFFWQSALLAVAVLALGLVGTLVRVARLNREIKALAVRLTTLEDRRGQQVPRPQEMAAFPKTNVAHYSSRPNSADVLKPEFSADSMIETAISMIKAGDTLDEIHLKLGIEPELLKILIQQHKTV